MRACFSLLALAPLAAVQADILHLGHGGTVQGEITDQNGELITVRTTVGIVKLPRDAVVRIESAPSPFQEYEQRKSSTADTPEDHAALASWCEQSQLLAERRQHLLRAIELDPNFEPARTALGYVRVGPLWIEGRTAADPKKAAKPAEDAAGEPDRENKKVVAAIQSSWTARIRAIRYNMLDSAQDRFVRSGRIMILEIHDPLAILPLVRALADGNVASREVLVQALGGFEEDEATLNLAVLALADPDSAIRRDALSTLVRRNDPRIAVHFRKALQHQNSELVRRAAVALGTLKDRPAVPDLIEALKAEQWKWVETPVRTYFGDMSLVFSRPTRAMISTSASVSHSPQIGVFDLPGTISVQTQQQFRNVTVLRTEVLEALRQITGQDFGFERAAWRRWYEEHRS